jgi:hypothetical protein
LLTPASYLILPFKKYSPGSPKIQASSHSDP